MSDEVLGNVIQFPNAKKRKIRIQKKKVEASKTETLDEQPNNLIFSCGKCNIKQVADLGKWKMNIVGLVEVQCPNCGSVFRSSPLLEDFK